MCSPTALFAASLAISAASTGASMKAQGDAAKANAEYQGKVADMYNRTAEQTSVTAVQEYVEQTAAENISQLQNQEAASEEMQRIRRERIQKMGAAVASSEAAGVAMQLLLGDYHRQEATYRDAVSQRLDFDRVNALLSNQQARVRAKNRALNHQQYIPQSTQGPNYLAGVLGFGGSALSSYGQITDYGRTSLLKG